MKTAHLVHLAAQVFLLAGVWLWGCELWELILYSVGALWITYILAHGQAKQAAQPLGLKAFFKDDLKFVLLPVLVFVGVTALWPSTRSAPADFFFRLALNGRLYRPKPVYRLESLEARPEIQDAFERMRRADVCVLKVGLRSSMKDRYPSRLRTCRTLVEIDNTLSFGAGSEIAWESRGEAPFLIFKFDGRYVLTGPGKNGDFTADQTVESVAAVAARLEKIIQDRVANERRSQQQLREDAQRRQDQRDKAARSFE